MFQRPRKLLPRAIPAGLAAAAAEPLDPDILASTPRQMDDGGVELTLPGPAEPEGGPQDAPHDANLVELLSADTLATIAAELLEGIEADVDSNDGYYEILAKGVELLGLKPGERETKPFDGAAGARHPLLKECVTRFGANASGELLPADGPVKIRIIGDVTPQQEEKAARKQAYMNYYLTEEDEDYADDFDQMCPMIGLYGSMFRKVWRDPLRSGAPTSRHFTPYDIVVSHNATTMCGPYRVTQIEPMPASEIKRLQLQAWFANVKLSQPTDDMTKAREAKQRSDFRRPTDLPDDVDHVLYHCHCLLDVPGLEHTDDEGEPTGLPLPYIVTIDVDSQKVLRLARNWQANDANFRPREYFAHYRYMPGLGFYGWGLIHLVGGDSDTLTVLRRQGLNAFTLNSFPGGLKKKGITAESPDLVVGPGEFKDVECGELPIQAAVMPMPYRDVPPSFSLLNEDVLQGGQRMGNVADVAVGDAREDALPGTVLALIAQATKVEGAVIKRMHRAQRKELRLLADLFGTMDQETYPFTMNGTTGAAIKADFLTNTDVCPVSDPNLPTQTQRLSQAQATMTIAQQSGGLVSMKPAIEDMFRVMGKSDQDIARLMPPPTAGVPADPVTEFAMALQGGPLKAVPGQDHVSHIQAHITQLQTPGLVGAPPGHALQAHIAEHTALFYMSEAQRMTGMPMPPPPGAQPGQPGPPPAPAPLEMQNKIAAAVAAASQQLRQQLGLLAPPAPGAAPGPQTDPAEMNLKKLEISVQQADQERKAEETARQDQIEATRTIMTMKDNAEQRVADLRKSEIQLEIARVKERGQVAAATVEHHTEALSGQTAMTVAQEKTEQARHAAKARETAAKTSAQPAAPMGGDEE